MSVADTSWLNNEIELYACRMVGDPCQCLTGINLDGLRSGFLSDGSKYTTALSRL